MSKRKEFLENDEWEVLTPDGYQDFKGLSIGKNKVVKITLEDEIELTCTADHKIFYNLNDCKSCGDYKVGESVYTYDGLKKIIDVEEKLEETVYDLVDVSNGNRFYGNSILIHNCIFADEVSFIPDHIWDDFYNSVLPAISGGKKSKIIMVSTPKGMNHFYKIYRDAVQNPESNFRAIKIPWWERPDRDEEWRKNTLADMGHDKTRFSQEFGCVRYDTNIDIDGTLQFIGDFFNTNSSEIVERFHVQFKYNTIGMKVKTPSGFKHFDAVAKLKNNNVMLEIETRDGNKITVTNNHTFSIGNTDVIANTLVVGSYIETIKGVEIVSSIKKVGTDEYVYELVNVDGGNVYYTNEILSHNCQFLGSSNTLIDPEVLERVEYQQPVELKYGGAMKIYEPPKPGEFYILGVDSAKGNGSDYSTIQVLKIESERSIVQVAVYRNNLIGPDEFAQLSIGISEYYNKAFMMVESNDIGELVVNKIWYDYECDRILNCDAKGLGIRATRKSKLAGNLLLKRYMENGWLEIVDDKTLYELSRYEEVSPNVFHAAGQNEHDDTVTSLIWGLYYLTTVYYDKDDNSMSDVRKIDSKYRIDNDDSPVFISDDDNQFGSWEMY